MEPETSALKGIRLAWHGDGRPFFADGSELLEQLLKQLKETTDIVDLRKLVERLLGPQAFSAGVIFGAGSAFVLSVVEMADLLKTFILADLFDQCRLRTEWSVMQPGGVVRHMTAKMLERYFGDELRDAALQRDIILTEIGYAFQHPKEFFGSLANDYVAKFKKYANLSADPSLASQFQAGCIFGELLLDVLAVIGTVAAVAKLATKVPRLISLAKKLKGKIARRKSGGKIGSSELTVGETAKPAKTEPAPKEKAGPTAAEQHRQDLGQDPATGRFRPAEADTALRLEEAKGVALERFEPAPGQKGDWIDKAGKVYDGCSPPASKYFDSQLKNGNFEKALKEHVEHATVDFVVVDTSGLGLTAAQEKALQAAIGRAAAGGPGKIVRLP